VIEMVIALVTNCILEGTSGIPSSAFLEASLMAAAVRPVAPFMDEDYETRSAAFTVCFGKCRTVGSSDERFMMVMLEPGRLFKNGFEYFEVFDHVRAYFGYFGMEGTANGVERRRREPLPFILARGE